MSYSVLNRIKKAIILIVIVIFDFFIVSKCVNSGLVEKASLFVAEEQKPKNVYYVVAEKGLNLREEAATSSKVITSIPYGGIVIVNDINGNWAFVSYEQVNGWCSTKYISTEDPNN